METHIMERVELTIFHRNWEVIIHTPRKRIFIAKVVLDWNPPGRRKSGRPNDVKHRKKVICCWTMCLNASLYYYLLEADNTDLIVSALLLIYVHNKCFNLLSSNCCYPLPITQNLLMINLTYLGTKPSDTLTPFPLCTIISTLYVPHLRRPPYATATAHGFCLAVSSIN